MTQHTPGPWAIETDRDAGHSNHQRHHIFAIVGGGNRLAVCCYKQNEEANARLIAAAPDLLEALKEALEIGDLEGWCIRARAAIAKAEGRSEVLQCSCGMRFSSMMAEAKHRHNYPMLCRPKRKAPPVKKKPEIKA